MLHTGLLAKVWISPFIILFIPPGILIGLSFFPPNSLGSRRLEIFFFASKRAGVSQQRDRGDIKPILKP